MRAAATVGGNLALARNRRLESDLAPLLLAAGARVALASADSVRCACAGTYARVCNCRMWASDGIASLLHRGLATASSKDPRVHFWVGH